MACQQSCNCAYAQRAPYVCPHYANSPAPHYVPGSAMANQNSPVGHYARGNATANQNTSTKEQVVTSDRARMGISNIIHGVLNVLPMLCSLLCMGMGIYLATGHGSECLRSLQWPLIGVGVFLFVFALVGILGAFLRIKILLWLYLAVALLIIVALLGIAIFAFAVTNRGSGEPVNGKAYEEYHLGDYSKWMQHCLHRHRLWAKIKQCIQDKKVCKGLNYPSPNSFVNANLSPLQSGCCKPPTACGLTFVNATYWTPSKNMNSVSDADCGTWNNDPSNLCYDCDSCRAAVAETSRRAWSKMALACAVIMVFLIVVYSTGCCAARTNKNRYYEKQKVVKKAKKTGYSEKRQVVSRMA